MVQLRVGAVRRFVAVALVSFAVLLVGLGQGSARADVSVVSGGAYGYSCAVRAFGIACSAPSATPKVTLAPDASNSPQAATVPSGNAFTGPATVFSSGQIDVRTQGTLGAGGSVTSSTGIARVNASGNEALTASSLASSCTASETGATGSTTVNGGTLQIDNGDSDPTNTIPDHAAVDVPVPANPAPNTSYDGHVHIGSMTDTFTYVFNEQVGSNGSITVNAVHEYLRGPAAVGEAIFGQSACGVNTAGAGMPPPPPPPPPPMDRAAPTAKLAGSRSQKLGKSVAVTVSCADEACLATASGTVPVPQVKAKAAAKAKVYKLKKVTRSIAKGGSVTLKSLLSKAARTAIKRTLRGGKGITVKLRVTVADAAGNSKTLTRQVKLKL